MGKIGAFDGPELLAEEHAGVAADIDGLVRLASANRIVDPGFRDFAPNGDLERWVLGAPPAPDGWGVYVRDNRAMTEFSEQNGSPLSLSAVSFYEQTEALVNGPSPPDETISVVRPGTPRVEIFAMPDAGLPQGWTTLAVAWIANHPVARSLKVTRPSLRTEPIFVNQGEGLAVRITPPPAGVVGIVVYMSPPVADELQALNQPLFGQLRIPVDATLKTIYRVTGPLHKSDPAMTVNGTVVGNYATAGTRAWFRKSGGNVFPMNVQLGYTVFDRFGQSTIKGLTGWINVQERREGRVLSFRPRRFPDGALQWKPYLRFKVVKPGVDPVITQWFTLGAKLNPALRYTLAQIANIWSPNSATWPNRDFVLHPMSPPGADTTGIAGPSDVMPQEVSVIDLQSSSLPPATYWIKGSLYFGETDESAPSPEQKAIISATGYALRVHKPMFVNRFENPEVIEHDNNGTTPRKWVPHLPAKTTTTPGRVRVDNKAGGNVAKNLVTTPPGWLDPGALKHVMRLTMEMINRTKGKVRLFLDEFDVAGALIKSGVAANVRSGKATARRRVRAGSTGRNAIQLSPNARSVKLRAQARGDQDFELEVSNLGLFGGGFNPLKRSDEAPGVASLAAEAPERSYPHGGYLRVVEDPLDGAYEDLSGELAHENMEDGAVSPPWTKTASVAVGSAYSVSEYSENGALIPSGHSASYVENAGETGGSVGARLRMKTAPTTNPDGFLKVFDQAGAVAAEARWKPDGSLVLWNGAAESAVWPAGDLETEDDGFFELLVEGFGAANGTARLFFGDDRESLAQIGPTAALDLSGKTYGGGRIASENGASKHASELRATRFGSASIERLPGNYLEYYGPPGTPFDQSYGPSGARWPLTPGETVALSVYAQAEEPAAGTQLLRCAVKDRAGRVIEALGPLVSFADDAPRRWERHEMSFTASEDAAYVEVVDNRAGEGRFRLQAPMLNDGPAAIAYTDDYAPEGHVRRVFSGGTPGVGPGHPYEEDLNAQKRLLGIYAVETTDDEEEGGGETSVTVSFRSGPTREGPWTAYTTDLSALPKDEFYDVRATLATSNPDKSPELRALVIDVEREVAILCDPDGREYHGGALVSNLPPAPAERRLIEEHEFDDGGKGFTEWGDPDDPPLYLEGFSVHCYHREGYRAITSDAGREEVSYVVEGEGKRYGLGYTRLSLEHDRDSDTPAGYTLMKSSEVTAEVVSESEIL